MRRFFYQNILLTFVGAIVLCVLSQSCLAEDVSHKSRKRGVKVKLVQVMRSVKSSPATGAHIKVGLRVIEWVNCMIFRVSGA
jgi:hypothetical protein